jgi:hypothetical protein
MVIIDTPTLCRHYECRCARAEELAQIAERTGRGFYLQEAVAVHSQMVRCRKPTKGNEDAR